MCDGKSVFVPAGVGAWLLFSPVLQLKMHLSKCHFLFVSIVSTSL